jgi:hypothetical protein
MNSACLFRACFEHVVTMNATTSLQGSHLIAEHPVLPLNVCGIQTIFQTRKRSEVIIFKLILLAISKTNNAVQNPNSDIALVLSRDTGLSENQKCVKSWHMVENSTIGTVPEAYLQLCSWNGPNSTGRVGRLGLSESVRPSRVCPSVQPMKKKNPNSPPDPYLHSVLYY